ncbi:MAG TPA: DSD1 family PLP-dependent enzyme [Polyangia bacterium]|nr:DSD1 family PLP-dependent enzyme [Polyangia bacterium]
MREWRRGQPLADIDTPALILDIAAAERNIRRMAEAHPGPHGAAAGAGHPGHAGRPVRLRPHVKTHKTPLLAHRQLAAGAIGVTCAKLGEVEIMVQAGIRDILLSSEVVGPAKVGRLVALSRHARIHTVVDDLGAATALSEAAQAAGLRLPTLLDVDVGQGRTGVLPGEPALALAQALARRPGLEIVGVQGYEGHLQHIADPGARAAACQKALQLLVETAEALRAAGHDIAIVTTGGTGTHAAAGGHPGVTEIQPGSYVVMDAQYGGVGGLGFEHALFLLTTVISKTRPDVAIVDAGWKSASSDAGAPLVHGTDGARYVFAGDEHGRIHHEATPNPPRVGDKLLLVPSHCDTTINLHDVYYVVRDGRLEDVWPIAARGQVQ